MNTTQQLFDVVAVTFACGATRVTVEKRAAPTADATVPVAVARLGVDVECFKVVPHEVKS